MRSQLLPLLLLFCVLGCSEATVLVSGKVTMDDQPLANASVIFEPAGGAGSATGGAQGTTDAQGEFTLSALAGDAKGARLGKYKVRITVPEKEPPSSADPTKLPKQVVPVKYNGTTELTFDVPAGGSKEANFKLKSK